MTNESPSEAPHEQRIAQLPCWPGQVTVSPLSGGMTNHNYRVTTRGGDDYVVRIGRDLPEHGVMRFNELAAARAAHAAGISPEVVFAADGVLVSRFIHGRTLTDADVRRPQMLAPLIDVMGEAYPELVAKRTSGMMQPQLAEKIARATRREYPEGIRAPPADAGAAD